MPATLAEICERLGMPEREARAWLERFALEPEAGPDGVARHPDAHETLLAIVNDVLGCPYASVALAVHAVEAALAPDYPDEHWPRELDRLKARLLARVDEARERRAARGSLAPADEAPAENAGIWRRLLGWIGRRTREAPPG